jgi:hypothetical protein
MTNPYGGSGNSLSIPGVICWSVMLRRLDPFQVFGGASRGQGKDGPSLAD